MYQVTRSNKKYYFHKWGRSFMLDVIYQQSQRTLKQTYSFKTHVMHLWVLVNIFTQQNAITSITNSLVCRRNNTVFQQGSMNPITKNPTLYWYTIFIFLINLWNKTIYKLVIFRHLNICSSIICNIVLWFFFFFFFFFLNGSYFYTKLWFRCVWGWAATSPI